MAHVMKQWHNCLYLQITSPCNATNKCVAIEGKPEIDGSHYHCHLCPAIHSEMMYSETTLESTLNQVPPSKITTLMILISYHLRQTLTQLTTAKMKLIFLIRIPTRTVHVGIETNAAKILFLKSLFKTIQGSTIFHPIILVLQDI